MPDAPDAIVNLTAEFWRKEGSEDPTNGAWVIYAVPNGAHTSNQRVELGSGRSGTGVMFPVDMLEMFAGVRS